MASFMFAHGSHEARRVNIKDRGSRIEDRRSKMQSSILDSRSSILDPLSFPHAAADSVHLIRDAHPSVSQDRESLGAASGRRSATRLRQRVLQSNAEQSLGC